MNRYLVPATAVGALLLAGCGTGASDTPEPTTDKPETVAFDPCNELSNDALRTAGLDPASKSTSIDPPDGQASKWKICRWTPSGDSLGYSVGIGSTTFTQADLPANKTVTGFQDVQIGSRAGKTYYPADDPDQLRCYVSMPAGRGGMHNIIVSWQYSERESASETPPCGIAVERAKELEPYLP